MINALLQKGVVIPAPETVYIAPEVDLRRIAPQVTIHAGCRLSGKTLSVDAGSVLGAEAPLTLKDCQLGCNVKLAGGFADHATFLDGANGNSCAHIRPGCLLEEEANFAHSVGLKQTIFMPFVTAGSLINFCDVIMAGGTSRKNHSEIGSSYIHFNYTPHQDKATASLVGDVPRGVLLNQPPIFLGGQGGMVGPLQIAYGTTIGAGVIQRRDITAPNRLAISSLPESFSVDFDSRVYGPIRRVVTRNFEFIGNLYALDQWYRFVRKQFLSEALYEGAVARLAEALDERMKRLDDLATRVKASLVCCPTSPAADQQKLFVEGWPRQKEALAALLAVRSQVNVPDDAAAYISALGSSDYLGTIQHLTVEQQSVLANWLDGCVAQITQHI